EMTVHGKPGKPTAGFPLFPPTLEIAARFPHSHRLDDWFLYIGEAKTPSPKNQQLRVGQIKPPKWAKGTCQTQLEPLKTPTPPWITVENSDSENLKWVPIRGSLENPPAPYRDFELGELGLAVGVTGPTFFGGVSRKTAIIASKIAV